MVGRKGTGTGLERGVQKEGKPNGGVCDQKESTACHVVFESRVVLRIQEFEVHCVGSSLLTAMEIAMFLGDNVIRGQLIDATY
jgi:hypothetical protein